MSLTLNIIGMIGVAIILVTYFLLQTDRIQARELRYSILNAIGSGFILLSLIVDFNLPSFIIEVAWVLISLMGIFSRWRE
ncbi:MAG: hypothetical protein AAF126_10085 [Chloroflexota bacterium]